MIKLLQVLNENKRKKIDGIQIIIFDSGTEKVINFRILKDGIILNNDGLTSIGNSLDLPILKKVLHGIKNVSIKSDDFAKRVQQDDSMLLRDKQGHYIGNTPHYASVMASREFYTEEDLSLIPYEWGDNLFISCKSYKDITLCYHLKDGDSNGKIPIEKTEYYLTVKVIEVLEKWKETLERWNNPEEREKMIEEYEREHSLLHKVRKIFKK